MRRLIILSILLAFASAGVAQSVSKKTPIFKLDISAEVPQVEWLNPSQDNVLSKDKNIILQLRIRSKSPIKDISVFNNNEQLPMSRGIGLSGVNASNQDLEQQISLIPGMNNVKVVVENEEGGTSTVTRNISFNFSISGRRDYALIFGVNDYMEWSDLSNPVTDAMAIGEELSNNYGFETEIVKNPTKVQILEKIREYAGKSYGEKDQLLIFFAGHGKFDEVSRMGYLAGADSRIADLVGDSYISHSAYRDFVNNIPCEHIFVIIDACFGGTFDQLLARSGSRGMEATFSELTHSEFIERKLKYTTRKYLTSGGKEYVPDGRPGAHSPFARKTLEALRNYGGTDKILTYTEFMTYFEALNPQPRSGEFGINEPGSDFIFVAR